jgi:hypothetical protein
LSFLAAIGCGSSSLPIDAAASAGDAAGGSGGAGGSDASGGGVDAAQATVADAAGLATDVPASASDTPAPAIDGPRMVAVPDLGTGIDRPLVTPPGGVRDVDILFVIDNSPSMQEEQDNLRRNFPVLMEVLKKLPGGLPNLQIGVITSDLGAGTNFPSAGACGRLGGDRGTFQTKPECGLDANSRFIASFQNGTQTNFGPRDISQVFSCMANVGARGCGYEHQLQATRVALYEAITPENRGFLRRDALLAIILISDEDDCSADTTSNLFTDDASFPGTTASFRCAQTGHVCNAQPTPIGELDTPLESCWASDGGRLIKVKEIVESIRALKARPDEQIVVSGIFGWPTSTANARYRYLRTASGVDLGPICQSSNGDAMPGLRLKAFVDAFGTSGAFFSVCQDDYAPAMQLIAERVAGRLR